MVELEWKQNKRVFEVEYKNSKLKIVAGEGAGTGYGGFYGYINNEYEYAADNFPEVESDLVEKVDDKLNKG